jgi:hypothetical protein
MLNDLLEGFLAMVSLLVIFVIIERVRIVTGKEMLIEKFLAFLQNFYQRSAPEANMEKDLRGCDLPDKVQLIELYFHDTKSK